MQVLKQLRREQKKIRLETTTSERRTQLRPMFAEQIRRQTRTKHFANPTLNPFNLSRGFDLYKWLSIFRPPEEAFEPIPTPHFNEPAIFAHTTTIQPQRHLPICKLIGPALGEYQHIAENLRQPIPPKPKK